MRKTPGVRGLAPEGTSPQACIGETGRRRSEGEKNQLIHRLPPDFVRRILIDFNAGRLDAGTASAHLGVSRSRLYQLRAALLADRRGFRPGASGGDRRGRWSEEIHRFLESFLPLQRPPNYQLVADELARLCGFRRARSSVEAYAKAHFKALVSAPPRRPRVHRRFRRARIGELWQHDSSIHQWWPAPGKQTLLLTVDDHSGFVAGGSFVDRDTTWNHFQHFRRAFGAHGLPEILYTDGLSLFGQSSLTDGADPKSEFQRALRGLGVAHLVAPTPQAKGKIERRFRTFQGRLVTLMAHAGVTTAAQAEGILRMEIDRLNATRSRATGSVPEEVWERQTLDGTGRMGPVPCSSLLDLHLSLRATRRVNHDHTIDFEGRSYEIADTARKRVAIVSHPGLRFWVVEHTPKETWPPILAEYTL
jgi:hypothetical protein